MQKPILTFPDILRMRWCNSSLCINSRKLYAISLLYTQMWDHYSDDNKAKQPSQRDYLHLS